MLDLIDTHCHLDIVEFDATRADLVARCAADGMQAILVPGVTLAGWQRLRDVCDQFELLRPAFGLHPCYTADHLDEHVPQLDAWITPDVIAVGEIGLDTFHGDQDFARQLELFSAQVAIARQHRLPLILHARKTHDQMLKVLRQQKFQYGGVVHAFSGSLQQAQYFNDLGFAVGFGGGATYDRAQKLRTILKTLPLDWIVLETDSPDIQPCFARGEDNTPFNLFRITEILAEVLQMAPAELATHTTRTAQRIFRL
ncbi:MAG TPA: TatD family hydrolase [Dongiaceae bacterium]|nr:TatD family hydrolase [Dongiaceae bacterium]